jgi:hypothetical protein
MQHLPADAQIPGTCDTKIILVVQTLLHSVKTYALTPMQVSVVQVQKAANNVASPY